MPFRFATPLGELSLFTTLTTFGTPLDVTIDELAIELFFPADDRSDEMLHAMSLAATADHSIRSIRPINSATHSRWTTRVDPRDAIPTAGYDRCNPPTRHVTGHP